MRIIFGAVTSIPPYTPGIVWSWLQYVLGLRELGHDVYWVEEVQPGWCVDASGRPCVHERSLNLRLFSRTMQAFGLMGRACQLYDGGASTFGLSREQFAAVCKGADLLVNMSGHVSSELVLANVRRRAYVDQDPVYTQLWVSAYGQQLNLQHHDVFFTVGLNIGTGRTDIPDCGVRWHHVLPPVVLDLWPATGDGAGGPVTTVASAHAYGDLCYRGRWYRSKYHELLRFSDLPMRSGTDLRVALGGYSPEVALPLEAGGWQVIDARTIGDLGNYRRFIAASRAEIGIAKNAYVRGRSGWFSDRTAHYLASGKPAAVQSTGLEPALPTGAGLLTFSTLEEAVEALSSIDRDYRTHARAAREFASEHLDHGRVLPGLLEAATG